ncbi:non-heme iron oxygenase ferredoxin subunit [Tessaracoccus sp. OS52]|nr:non-heme iron oxygenase ferredoxin subunit [Tessaracoccus sp. OS52]
MSFRPVADVSEVAADRPLAVDIPATDPGQDDLRVAVVLHQGEYFAIEDECSHGAVPLSDGDVVNGTVECYLHGSVFDLRTGRALNLPATEPVRVFPCRVDGTSIAVDVENPITAQTANQES